MSAPRRGDPGAEAEGVRDGSVGSATAINGMEPIADTETEGLSDQQYLFVRAYLACNCNATEAAKRAGYVDPHANGWRVRRLPQVDAEIRRLLAEQAMPAEEVLARLTEIARGEHTQFLKPLRGGRFQLDTKALAEAGKAHLVNGYKETEHGPQVEFARPLEALSQLGRAHKLFTDRTEHDGSVEVRYSEQAEQFERRLAGRVAERGTAEPTSGSAPGVEGKEAL